MANVSMPVAEGEAVAIMGPGSGETWIPDPGSSYGWNAMRALALMRSDSEDPFMLSE